MANFNISPPAHVPKFNGVDSYRFCFLTPAGTVATDTLTVTLPPGVPDDIVPVSAVAYSTATPALPVPVTVTSHNRNTGVSVLTIGTGAAAGQKVYVEYVNA